jgi:multiple sugar transport system ATP-binding protein
LPPKDRDIAMVFQSYALYPHMTAFENMAFALKLRKAPRQDIAQRVERAARILGIETLLQRKPKTLSGGQRQRVALGRAIVRDPQCFLFDEPLSNLDAKLRGEMRTQIKQLQADLQSTAIYVTHDQEEAMTLGDRLVVMNQGTIQQCGAPLDVYRSPANRFVAAFVGSPPMNFFEGKLVEQEGRLLFDEGSGKLAVPESRRASLQAKVGSPVVLGVRPQALSRRAHGTDAAECTLNMQLDLIEPLGDKMNVHLRTSAHPGIVAQLDAEAGLTVKTILPIRFDLEQMHFFEADAGGARL